MVSLALCARDTLRCWLTPPGLTGVVYNTMERNGTPRTQRSNNQRECSVCRDFCGVEPGGSPLSNQPSANYQPGIFCCVAVDQAADLNTVLANGIAVSWPRMAAGGRVSTWALHLPCQQFLSLPYIFNFRCLNFHVCSWVVFVLF